MNEHDLDRALDDAFAPLRRAVEERAQGLALGEASVTPALARARVPEQRRLPRWAWLAAGIAAGALMTGSLLRWGAGPETNAPGGASERVAFARVEHTLGPVEILADDASGASQPLTNESELVPGARLRTAARAKCTLLLADQSRLLLDGETELELRGPRLVALRRGRVYAEITPAAERFVALAGPSRVEVLGTRLDLNQRIGATGPQAGRELTELAVLEGSALLCGTRVEAGSLATALDGRFEHQREARDLLVLTSWVNELMAFEPGREAEFQDRVDALLAMIGQTKMAHLYESEIRSLGDHCALPLLRYVESADSRTESGRRRDAARILADVATLQQMEGLGALLNDSDPTIRVSAASGIARLTGGPPGGRPEDLAGQDHAASAARWRAWLEQR